MKIHTQYITTLVIFAAILLLVAASALVTNWMVDRISFRQDIVRQVRLDSSDLHSIAGDYLLFGAEHQVTLWNARLAGISAMTVALESGSPEQQALVRDIQDSLQRWDDIFQEVTSVVGSAGAGNIGPDLFQDFWSRMEVQHRSLISSTARYAQTLTAEISGHQRANLYLVITIFAAFALYLILNYFLFRRRVLASLARLEEGTRVIASGNLDYTIPVERNDEVGSLSVAFNRMAAHLKADQAVRRQVEAELVRARDELEEVYQQLRQYSWRIIRVQEEERKRIAFELHDDTAQYLGILKMQIDALVRSGKISDPDVLDKLRHLEKDADRAFNDVRRYSHELRPVVLEHMGLLAALEQIAEDYKKLDQLHVEIRTRGLEPELPEEVKLVFFRIAQEALNNTRKHSRASRAEVDIIFEPDRLEMSVSDKGIGFDLQVSQRHPDGQGSLGLLSMQERADLINADLKIESAPGKGTRITLLAPLSPHPVDPQTKNN